MQHHASSKLRRVENEEHEASKRGTTKSLDRESVVLRLMILFSQGVGKPSL
jgi:hypothetical protein